METPSTAKTALITGAASGIGQELARLFAKDGYQLVLVDRNQAGLDLLATHFKNQYGTVATLITKDLANPQAPQEIYDHTKGQNQPIDVLVNNAGEGHYGQFATQTDLHKELAIVQGNATSLMHLTKLYLKDMVERNEGKILMLGSEVSVAPNPMMAVYAATKAFIKSFAESVRSELKGNGSNVSITVLMPGATNTNFFKNAGAEHVRGADPQKTANPADVAKAGYQALMAGEDHVVAGFVNKLRVAMAHVLPDPLIAANARRDMMPRDEEAEKRQQALTKAVVVGALVLGGLWLLTRNRSTFGVDDLKPNASDRARYRHQAGKVKAKTQSSLGSVADSVKGSYQNVKESVGQLLF